MKLSPIWKLATKNMRSIAQAGLSTQSQLECIQRTIYISVGSEDRQEQKDAAECWCRIMEQRHGPGWSIALPDESEFYHKPLTFQYHIDGIRRTVTQDWFKKSNLALECFKFKPEHVLELGAGFGQVGRLLLSMQPRMRYTIVDLPETLHFAEIFLRLNFPNLKIVSCQTEASLTEPCAIRLVPADLAEAWAKTSPGVDLFLNSSSLGEMDEQVQAHYLRLLHEFIRPKHAILLNRLLNTYDPVIDKFREHEAAWYFNLNGSWRIAQWELEPDFTRIPYSEMFHNREVFIVATSDMFSFVSAPEVSHYKQQYWFKKFSAKSYVRWSDQLLFDTRTLRDLFESVRIHPREDNLDMLIKYLWCIRKARPFEEMPLLFSKYRMLAGRPHPLDSSWFVKLKSNVLNDLFNVVQLLPSPMQRALRQFRTAA